MSNELDTLGDDLLAALDGVKANRAAFFAKLPANAVNAVVQLATLDALSEEEDLTPEASVMRMEAAAETLKLSAELQAELNAVKSEMMAAVKKVATKAILGLVVALV